MASMTQRLCRHRAGRAQESRVSRFGQLQKPSESTNSSVAAGERDAYVAGRVRNEARITGVSDIVASMRGQSLLRDEGGQSLIVMVVTMAVILAIAAFAIDVGGWYATRHHAQVAADAAALAGANCMANGGTVSSCTTGTTSPATVVSDNGFSSETVSFNSPGTKKITVTVKSTGSTVFSGVFGMGGPAITATAVASWTGASTATCTAGSTCDFAFASSQSSSSPGLTITSGTINGSVVSDCAIDNGAGSGTFTGSVTYGPGTSCNSSSTGLPSSATAATSLLCFPIDYSGLTQNPSACGGTDSSPGFSATSSYCTVTETGSATVNANATPGVYCFPPGSIATIGPGTAQSGPGEGITIIAPQFVYVSNATTVIYPYQTASGPLANNELAFYQYSANYTGWNSTNGGCSSIGPTFAMSGNKKLTMNGAVFAPCAAFVYNDNNAPAWTGFVEAYSVQLDGSKFSGDGPSPSSGPQSNTAGTDQLTQ